MVVDTSMFVAAAAASRTLTVAVAAAVAADGRVGCEILHIVAVRVEEACHSREVREPEERRSRRVGAARV